jgi:hypothetical protein
MAAVKTGRLLKFHRAGTDIQAYVYREGGQVCAALYVLSPGPRPQPSHSFTGGTEAEVETNIRAWVEAHYPRDAPR